MKRLLDRADVHRIAEALQGKRYRRPREREPPEFPEFPEESLRAFPPSSFDRPRPALGVLGPS
jgi:hypothetical protein